MKLMRRSQMPASSSSPPPPPASSSSPTPTSPSTSSSSSCSPASWIQLRSLLIVVSSASSATPASRPHHESPKSPWCIGKEKRALSRRLWSSMFSQDGKLRDDGVKFLKKVRSAGVDPSIRAEVWPFLLGVYSLRSTEAERNIARRKKRKLYERLRKQCRQLMKPNFDCPIYDEDPESPDYCSSQHPIPIWDDNLVDNSYEDGSIHDRNSIYSTMNVEEEKRTAAGALVDLFPIDIDFSETCSSDDDEDELEIFDDIIDTDPKFHRVANVRQRDLSKCGDIREDFATWQRIIRKDAVRDNAEWVMYSPSQAAQVSEEMALEVAGAVGLKDHHGLEPCLVFHAARMVAILEAYALYDPEIGYCQGMSDLLSPVLAVVGEDYEAFWCFVGLMRKARHNFRLDEVGIRRQLGVVSRIIKRKDANLYRHLERLQAEDCCFVYRMVVVMFRRELSFEQTLCLWEVMWADQAAVRAGVGKSVWGRIGLRAPPTDDLLLFAIAACVLQRRRLIMNKYSSVDDILRECNGMAGKLDIWRLLNDAHGLVVALHDKL